MPTRRFLKKILLVPVLCLLVLACSTSDLVALLPTTPTSPPPAASPTKTRFVTSTATPTIRPTKHTPTFTGTPTLIYSGPTSTPSLTPFPTGTVGLLITSAPNLSLPSGNVFFDPTGIFKSIAISGNQLYWGVCEPNFVKVRVKVADPSTVKTVLLELSLKDKDSGEITAWGGGAIMDTDGAGVFTYTLTAENFEHYRDYKSAWGRFQAVAFASGLKRLGGSVPYLNSLTIAPCP